MVTRFATRKKRAYNWLPPKGIISSDIQVDSISVNTVIWSAEFTRALCPEIGFFRIILDNNNEEFSEKYKGDEVVEFFIDRTNGTTRRFKGNIDTIFPQDDSGKGSTIKLAGNHVSGELLTIHVTESYASDTTIPDILDDLNSTYLTGYTINYTASDITTKPDINWDEKPLWECVNDLRKLVGADAYVTDDKQINFFDENSVINNDEAIVKGISLINAPTGIGKQTLTKRDKIKVYGEAGKLPVISTSGTGTKEEVIFDSKIITSIQADEISAAQLFLQLQTPREGEGLCFMMAAINPGDYLWYSNNPQKILEQVKLYKYTQMLPNERTKIYLSTSREIPHIFKKRIENELALQTITNPFKMTSSWNFVFDSEEEITAKDSNVILEDGIIKLSSGVQGTFTATQTVTTAITKVHLKVIGSALVGTVYKFSTDGGENVTNLTPESEITVPSGTSLWLKVEFNSAGTEIDSLAVLSR